METMTKINNDLLEQEASKMGGVILDNPNAVMAVAEQAIQSDFMPMSVIPEPEVEAALAELDLNDSNSITLFGSDASRKASTISREMMAGVRNKDTGPVGDVMNDMMSSIRGLDPSDLNGGGIFGWLKSKAARAAQFAQKYETVEGQIDGMASMLDQHRVTLMTSVAMNDRLYEASESQFHSIEVYIVAGQRMLDTMNSEMIPAMKNQVDANPDNSLLPQEFRDLQAKRDQLERKVHDLKLVRMVTLQSLPKIRMTQDNDLNLISKIETIVSTTIPIWEQSMAIALSVAKTQRAADATNAVTDQTEQMIIAGADQFKTATLSAKKSVERGVVSVEAITAANDTIVETINEALAVTQQGKQMRADAEKSLAGTEAALRQALEKSAASQAEYA